jgi:hypothetical protein
MKAVNFTQYTALLMQVYLLQDRLRKDPPSDPAEYLAAVTEIQNLWNQIAGMTGGDDGLTPEQITDLRAAGHADNQTAWVDPHPTHPPAGTPGLYDFVYDDKPDDANYSAGDEVMKNAGDPPKWLVVKKDSPVIGRPGWTPDHVVT